MKNVCLVLASSLMLLSLAAKAGDRIGNGGGVWACQQPSGTIEKAELVDLFEAREELGWPMVAFPNTQPLEIVDEVRQQVLTDFPNYASSWNSALQTVLQNSHYINADLKFVDDGLFRVQPPRGTCPDGAWNYIQFANFTLLGHIDISNDLWTSPVVAPVNKAALLWHEAIYYWLRTNYSDTNSVRARYIVGLLFSSLSATEKVAKLNALFSQAPPPAPHQWFCMLYSDGGNKPYAGYGSKLSEAQTNSLVLCQNNEKSASFCRADAAQCEELTSSQDSWSCQTTNTMTSHTFTSRGRGELEAKYKTQTTCFAGSIGQEFFCPSYGINCSKD